MRHSEWFSSEAQNRRNQLTVSARHHNKTKKRSQTKMNKFETAEMLLRDFGDILNFIYIFRFDAIFGR